MLKRIYVKTNSKWSHDYDGMEDEALKMLSEKLSVISKENVKSVTSGYSLWRDCELHSEYIGWAKAIVWEDDNVSNS